MAMRTQKILAAAGYLLVCPLAFLPGLLLWFWAEDRNPWLAAHGRRAATVNFAIFIGYLLLAPFTHILGLLATLVRLFEFSHLRFQIPHVKFLISNPLISAVAAPHGLVYALWGPHYWAGIFTSLVSLVFLLLWLAMIVVNIWSAWRAARGLGPWGGRRKDEGGIGVFVAGDVEPGGKIPMRQRAPVGLPIAAANEPGVREPERRLRKILQSAAALTFYLAAAALLLLVPLHFDLRHYLIAYHRLMPTDPSIFLWSLVWWPWAIGHGLNPFYTHFIWAPVGQNLLWMTSVPSLALLLAPVTHFFGPIVSYNLIALLAPVLAAWTTYLLCRHVTGRFWSSLFGGWIFGFSTYEFAHLQLHMHLFVTAALPLAVWIYLLRRDGKLSRRWYVGLIALLVLFQFGVSTEILASAVPLGLLAAFLAALFYRPEHLSTTDRNRGIPSSTSRVTGRWSLFLETVAGLVLAGILLLPDFYYLFLVHYVPGPFLLPRSADLTNFLVPTPVTWLGSGWATSVAGAVQGSVFERSAYLGLPLFVLLLLFIREFARHRAAWLLLMMLGLFFLLSLGPWLELRPGVAAATPLVLPWILPTHLPLFDKILPIRLVVYIWLAAAVSATWWLAESKTHWGWKLLLAGLAMLFLLPNIFSARWVQKVDNPPFFTSGLIARYLPRGSRVIILPSGYLGYSMLWQAETHFYFTMIGGYTSYRPPVMPHAVSSLYTAFSGRHSDNHGYTRLRWDIRALRLQAVIVDGQHGRNSISSLLAPLHLAPIHTGGVWLYLLSRSSNPSKKPVLR